MRLIPIISVLLIAAGFFSCNSNIVSLEKENEYYIEGAAVKDLENDILDIAARIRRNDTLITDAVLTVGDDTLFYDNGIYIASYASAFALDTGSHKLKIISGDFVDSITFSVPDTFTIESIKPETGFYYSYDDASADWTPLLGASYYAYAVIKEEIPTPAGYSEFVTSGVTATPINTDAFRYPNGDLDTGLYYIYIYGLEDSPVPEGLLPVTLPAGIEENISKYHLTGKFGAVVISDPGTLHAVTEPQ